LDFKDPKKQVSALTSAALGLVWCFLELRHQTPPQALNQAIIAAFGAVFATGAITPKDKGTANA
jgi:hypothetical protein